MRPPRQEIYASARLITLVRILLLVLAIAVLAILQRTGADSRLVWLESSNRLQGLLWLVALFTIGSALVTGRIRSRWQLLALMIADLLWLAIGAYLTGGVASPITPLLFAVILTGNLVMPGPSLLLLPLVGAMAMSLIASAYLAGFTPFDATRIGDTELLIFPPRVLGNLTVQVAAFFLMHMLGQVLSRRLSEQRLVTDELLGQLDEGVLAIDRDGRILYVNAAVAASLGISPPSVDAPLAPVLLRPERPDLQRVWQAIEAPQRPQSLAVPTVDGRHLIVRVASLIGRRNRLLGTTVLIADETDLRQLEQEAYRAERLAGLGEMAAGIAHEVRNPLTSLRGCAQEIAAISRQQDGTDVTPLCNILISESDRLARLVGDFLDLSRMRAPAQRAVDLLVVLDRLEQLHGNNRQHAAVGLQIDCAADLPLLRADPDQLLQVLLNLTANAADAMAGRGTIRIRAELAAAAADEPQRLVEIVVSDSGCGIAPDKLESVFTPFYSSKSKGTGLGMTVVSRIVQAHRGRIDLESELGRGTSVRLFWPALSPLEIQSA